MNENKKLHLQKISKNTSEFYRYRKGIKSQSVTKEMKKKYLNLLVYFIEY